MLHVRFSEMRTRRMFVIEQGRETSANYVAISSTM
jgi:hypothetical protein